MRRFGVFLVFCFLFISCDRNRVFDENKSIPGNSWFYKNIIPFDLRINDTASEYNLYVNLRIDANYKYSNIFMWVHSLDPERNSQKTRVEIRLSDDGGKWLGSGLGDIYDYRFPVFKNVRFPLSGFYRFDLEQNMRDDTLAHIRAVGLRLEYAIK